MSAPAIAALIIAAVLCVLVVCVAVGVVALIERHRQKGRGSDGR